MSEFEYDGVTVPLPVGHVFEEITNYDGSVSFTNAGGVPTTEDRSIGTGTEGSTLAVFHENIEIFTTVNLDSPIVEKLHHVVVSQNCHSCYFFFHV